MSHVNLSSADQAEQLRQMADLQNASSNRKPDALGAIRCVMLGELGGPQKILPLVWHLAGHALRERKRCLIVDLAPAATKLTQYAPRRWRMAESCSIQALWVNGPHGKTLNFPANSTEPIVVLAQETGSLPDFRADATNL